MVEVRKQQVTRTTSNATECDTGFRRRRRLGRRVREHGGGGAGQTACGEEARERGASVARLTGARGTEPEREGGENVHSNV
jgi:hypothetical protein